MKYNSVYINEVKGNWILNILGNDIFDNLQKMGYICRKGVFQEYRGEDVVLHMWWRHAQPYPEAKINSVFITHVDDSVKEHDLIVMKDKFDLFFCMSMEDAVFLEELGFDKEKVFGLNLPIRNTYIRPVTIGIFSNCYSVGVKNEKWLLDYCKKYDKCRNVVFVFIGHGWNLVVEELSKLGCSYEWYCIDRSLPGEYMYQQLKLSSLDYYLYMGMDGGAMGTYDAYAMGCNLCISNDGYHKSISDIEYPFNDKQQFEECMNRIIDKQIRKLDFFSNNTAEKYVRRMAYVFENKQYPKEVSSCDLGIEYSVKEKRRNYYFPLSFVRLRQPLVSGIIKMINRCKYNKVLPK